MNRLATAIAPFNQPILVPDRTAPPQSGALCFVLDDEPAIGWLVTTALAGFGVTAEHFTNAPAMLEVLGHRTPEIIFLDLFLGDSDAIDTLRELARSGFGGAIQILSSREVTLLDDVRRVGARHGLNMLPVLPKPFRIDALRRVVERERLVPVAASAALAENVPAAAEPPIDLREAIRRNWLELWYQPKLDLRSGQVVGAEGLARIRHPDRGVLLPASFLPGASDPDLILLAETALHQALRDARDFAEARDGLRLAINVPVGALLDLPITSIVRDYRPHRREWDGIVLEVTEDQAILDIHATHEIATQLRIYRIALSIDDFGRGYSSFARLKSLPFAELKLDRSFVSDCATDKANAALCKTAVELAHRFGSLAVAEGIENAADLIAITRTGCDVAQGFIFARAMPKDRLIARLGSDRAGLFAIAAREPDARRSLLA